MKDKDLTTPKAILLDMDDTILASRQASKACWTNLCEKLAPRINGLTPEKLLATIYESIRWFWEDPERNQWGRLHPNEANLNVVSRALRQLDHHDLSLANEIAERFMMERIQAIQPFPGAFEVIRFIRDRGIQLALITNGGQQMQRAKIDKFELDRFFDHVLIEDEFGAGKPEKKVYTYTLNRLGIPPQEAWMIGDNLELDVAAPQRLGICGIWNDFEHSGLPVDTTIRPDKIVHSLFELMTFF